MKVTYDLLATFCFQNKWCNHSIELVANYIVVSKGTFTWYFCWSWNNIPVWK